MKIDNQVVDIWTNKVVKVVDILTNAHVWSSAGHAVSSVFLLVQACSVAAGDAWTQSAGRRLLFGEL